MEKIEKYKIKILTEDDLFDLIRTSKGRPDEFVAKPKKIVKPIPQVHLK